MKNKLLRFAYAIAVLVIAGAAEELLPSLGRVGFPILLATVHVHALKNSMAATIIFAIAAGAMEESICALPLLTSAGFFALSAVIAQSVRIPLLTAALTYPCYQLWLALWNSGSGGGFCLATLVALPVGWITFCMVGGLMNEIAKRVAIDEEE